MMLHWTKFAICRRNDAMKLHLSQCKYSRFRKKSEVKRSIIHWKNILCRKRFADTLHLVA